MKNYVPTSPKIQEMGTQMLATIKVLYSTYDNFLQWREEDVQRLLDEGCLPSSTMVTRVQEDIARLKKEMAGLQPAPTTEGALKCLDAMTWHTEAWKVAVVESPTYRDSLKKMFAAPAGNQAGTRRVVSMYGMDFVFRWCPAGKFMMGSPKSELGRDDHYDHETQHPVTLTKGFWMLETQVTQKMWQSVKGSNPSKFKGGNLPVEKVSWDECIDFCVKLSHKTGLMITLPTEAQWEYACRAGTTGPYAGDLDAMGWYADNSGGETHPVGQKQPNVWGLYDTYGNVCEWCQDGYESYYGAETDPTGPTNSSKRVFRGGSWCFEATACRSASRFSGYPDCCNEYSGFRLVIPTK